MSSLSFKVHSMATAESPKISNPRLAITRRNLFIYPFFSQELVSHSPPKRSGAPPFRKNPWTVSLRISQGGGTAPFHIKSLLSEPTAATHLGVRPTDSTNSAMSTALNLKNIQGDVIFGLPKRQQVRWEREGPSTSVPLTFPTTIWN